MLDFDERAAGYERGWLGRLHHEIADRTAALAVATVPAPDVGCGTGYLPRVLARDYPNAELLAGIDPAPAKVKAATVVADQRFRFLAGRAEELPYPSDSFDLVVSTTSFDHWADQSNGMGEPPARRCGISVALVARPLFRHNQGRDRERLIPDMLKIAALTGEWECDEQDQRRRWYAGLSRARVRGR